MLERLVDLSIHRHFAVLSLTLAFSLYGLYAFSQLRIEAYPDVTNLQVTVITLVPGQAAEEVERQVTIPIERGLSALPKMIDLRSISVFGLSTVIATFDDDTNLFFARQLVGERLRQLDLPGNITPVLGPPITPLGEVYRFTLEGPTKTASELRTILDWNVIPKLKQAPGVAEVVSFGGFVKEYHVLVDLERLKAYSLGIDQVYDALSRSNANIGAGYLRRGQEQYVVRGLGLIKNPDEIKLATLAVSKGQPVLIRDVASVVESAMPRQGAVGLNGHMETVSGVVLMRKNENSEVVLKNIHAKVKELENGILPAGVKIVPFLDRTVFVQRTLTTVQWNLLEGALLVSGVVWLFLRAWQGSLAVAIVIPLSLLTAFVGLHWIDVPANLISLGAIDFGIIVDGAVILVENIYKRLGEDRDHSVKLPIVIAQAAKEVARPTLFALCIIIAALIPIYAFQRVEGRIFKPMAYTYAFALLGALLFSMTTVLAVCAGLLKGGLHKETEPLILKWARRLVEPLLWLALRFRFLVLGVIFGLLLLSAFLMTRLGTEFLPQLNEGDLHIFVEMPNAISLSEGQLLFADMRKRLMDYPEVIGVLSPEGRPEDGTDTMGPNQGEVFIRLHPEEKWTTGRTKARLVELMRADVEEIPGVAFHFSQPISDNVQEAISGIRGQIVVKLFGENATLLQMKAREVLSVLKDVPGASDAGIYRMGKIPQLVIDLDRLTIARHGLTVEDVERAIETAVGGRIATEVWEGEKRFGVRVLLAQVFRADPSRIGEIIVTTPEGGRVPLSTLAQIQVVEGQAQLWRQNNSRFIAIRTDIEGRDMGSFVGEAMEKVKQSVEIPEGYYLTWGGEFENQQRAMARLAIVVPLAILAILVLLYFAFGSFRDAFLILLVAPCAFVGGIVTLWLTGTVFSVSAAVGLIALLGQTVLNGVLLVSTFRQLQEDESLRDEDVIVQGVRQRLRALLMTAMLASLGLVPAALSHGMGAETQRPFALVIIGGIVTSTALTIFLIPTLFSFKMFRGERIGAPPPSALWSLLLVPLFLGTLWGGPVSAATDPPMRPQEAGGRVAPGGASLSIQDAIRVFEEGNLDLRAARSQLEISKNLVKSAGLLENPVVSYSQNQPTTGIGPDGQTFYNVVVSQSLPVTSKLRLQREVARSVASAAEGSFRGQEVTLRAEVHRAFYQLLTAQMKVAMFEENLQRLEQAVDVLRKRVTQGATARYDLNRVEVEAERSRSILNEAKAEYSSVQESLRRALGPAAPLGPIEVTGDLSVAEYKELGTLVETAMGARPDLAAAHAQAQAASVGASLARKEVVPDVTFSIGHQQSWGPQGVGVVGALSVPLPINKYGQGTIAAARFAAQAAELGQRAIEQRIPVEVSRAWQVFNAKRRERDRYVKAVKERAEQNLKTAQLAYREGALGILEIVDAYRLLQEVQVRDLDLRATVKEAAINLEEAIGGVGL